MVEPKRPIGRVEERIARRQELAKLPPKKGGDTFAAKFAAAVSSLALAAENRGGALVPSGTISAIKGMVPK